MANTSKYIITTDGYKASILDFIITSDKDIDYIVDLWCKEYMHQLLDKAVIDWALHTINFSWFDEYNDEIKEEWFLIELKDPKLVEELN